MADAAVAVTRTCRGRGACGHTLPLAGFDRQGSGHRRLCSECTTKADAAKELLPRPCRGPCARERPLAKFPRFGRGYALVCHVCNDAALLEEVEAMKKGGKAPPGPCSDCGKERMREVGDGGVKFWIAKGCWQGKCRRCRSDDVAACVKRRLDADPGALLAHDAALRAKWTLANPFGKLVQGIRDSVTKGKAILVEADLPALEAKAQLDCLYCGEPPREGGVNGLDRVVAGGA
jgi:hypothetical protein